MNTIDRWKVVAVDGSPVAIGILRQINVHIETCVIDLERQAPPFPDDAFDLVCLINFLYGPLFAEAGRLVRPGGCIVAVIHTTRSSMNPLYTIEIGELRTHFAGWSRSSIAKVKWRSCSRENLC